MQEQENQEDQLQTDSDVQGESQANLDTQETPEPTVIYTTLDSTEQTPEEHRADQSKDPRKEESTITGTPALDETGKYHDEGEAMA